MTAVKSFEDLQRKEIKALYEEHGANYVQELLQQEIAKLKKKESELAVLKKKNAAQGRENDSLQDKARRLEKQFASTQDDCRSTQNKTKKLTELAERVAVEFETRRNEIQAKIKANCANLREQYEKQKEELDALCAENESLEKELNERKSAFEQSFQEFQDTLLNRTTSFQEIIEKCQETAKELEELHIELTAARQEKKALTTSIAVLIEQAKVYETQFSSFSEKTTTPESVKAIAEKQKEQSDKKIENLNAEKKEAINIRNRLDRDIAEFRAKVAACKREHIKLEKVRNQLERKCRQVREKQK